MEKTIRRFTNHEELRAETYRYWHTRPNAEVFETIWEMSRDAYRDFYRMRGIVPVGVRDGEGSTRSFTRIQRKAG